MLSVIITACRDELGCYLTAFAAKAQLDRAGLDYEIIVAADGGTEMKWEKAGVRCLRVMTGSPQGTRDAGIREARFPNVLLLESHVVVSDIQLLVLEHHNLGSALTFPSRKYEGAEMFDVYGHETDWDGNLWHKRLMYQCPSAGEPYRVSQFGQSCFMLDRKWYLDSGGYTELMRGWGGEEPFLCLKAWMLGRECWLVPSVWHAHYLTPGAHGGVMSGGDFMRNFDILAYVIAGRRKNGFMPTTEAEAERQRIMRGPFSGNVDFLQKYLREKGVPA